MKNVSSKSMGSMSARRVITHQVGNKVVVTERPKRRLPVKGKAEQARERFLDAVYYAGKQQEDPASAELYAKGITKKLKSVFAVALSDYLVAPKVEYINTIDYKGQVGDPIAIRANDDFLVTRVKVEILGADGTLIEDGDAATDDAARNLWIYNAKALNATPAGTTIRATAFDKPRNTGALEKVI